MATNALTCSASTLVAHKAPSPLSSGFVPRSVSFLSSSLSPKSGSSSRPNSLVVKAQDKTTAHYSHLYPWLHYKPALIDSPPYVRAPWGHAETDREIVMSFDMPGVEASELDVTIVGDELGIRFIGLEDRVDASGRRLSGLYDTKIQLPPYCIKQQASAELRNGILSIRIPRMTVETEKPIKVPVTRAP